MTYSPSRCLQTVVCITTLSAFVRLKDQLTSRLASLFLLWPESERTHCAKAKSFQPGFLISISREKLKYCFPVCLINRITAT